MGSKFAELQRMIESAEEKVNEFARRLDRDPENFQFILEKARRERELDDLQKQIQQCLKMTETPKEARNTLAELQRMKKNVEQKLQFWIQNLEQEPANPRFILGRAGRESELETINGQIRQWYGGSTVNAAPGSKIENAAICYPSTPGSTQAPSSDRENAGRSYDTSTASSN